MRRIAQLVAILVLTASVAPAVDTGVWQVGSYEEFMQGTLRDVSLDKEGRLRLAPEAHAVFSPDETLALSITADKDRNIFIGTGHQGKVFKIDPSGKGSLFFTTREPEIFAVAVAPDGAVFVGSSPEGKIYRVTPDGKSTVFHDPSAKYIWALAFDAKGNLYAGTGDQGKIFKIDSSGKGEVFFDSRQTHIMCLTLDHDGNFLAGSVPNGLIYRITPQGKGFVLYQANHPEIHDLALDADGRIYAAALGSPGGKGTPGFYQGAPPAAPAQGRGTTITVTADSDVSAEAATEAQAQRQAASTLPAARPAPQTKFPITKIPQGRGSLILIRPDNTVETVWSSGNESVFGLAVRRGQVLFSTDSNGRIFELDPSKEGPKVTLLAQTRETLATRILLNGPDVYVATSNIAKLFRLTNELGKDGSYESPVKDTKFISKWGNISWRAELPAGSKLELFTRSGNSGRPDQTWSDWVGPYSKQPEGEPIQSPAARFLQWKAVFKSSGKSGPDLSEVTASYLNQNLPPQIKSVNVLTAGEKTSSGRASSGGSGNITVTVNSSGSASSAGGGKSGTTVAWQADDPNGDQLIYSIYVRAEDEQEWHLIEDEVRQTNYAVEPNTLADGKYIARVVASDELSNPASMARQADLASPPFWIDRTPPTINTVKTQADSSGIQVQFLARDSTSPLRRAEASRDGEDWQDAVSDDGIVDARNETFTLRTGKLGPGEHVITLRAFDAAGNAGVGKAIVRIAAAGPTPSR